jgi:hypothetical protein
MMFSGAPQLVVDIGTGDSDHAGRDWDVAGGDLDLAIGDSDLVAPDVACDEDGSSGEAGDAGLRSSSPLSEGGEPLLNDVDDDGGVGPAIEELKGSRGNVLQHVCGRLQNPAPGPFDRDNLTWTKQVHSGGGMKPVHTAVIPWDRLEDFVEGEESMRDFPCTLNRKKRPEVKLGFRVQVRAGTYTQLIRYNTLCQLFCTVLPLFPGVPFLIGIL